MASTLSEEQWRTVFDLSQIAAELPANERRIFLEGAGASLEIAEEVLALLNECPSLDEPVNVGTKVGRFLIIKHLSGGGMGEVYSARDTELGRTVALKFLKPQGSGVDDAVERLIREARTASALNHPNIVTIHEVIRSESTVAIVMELVEGTALREMCGTPVPIDAVVDIGHQTALALAAAHREGIVHRDIKPENIIVRPDGRVKVLDFGLARHIATKTLYLRTGLPVGKLQSGTLPGGTLRYMSPEQARGEPSSPASDVFSFGLVLYELATGQHAFASDSPIETVEAILTKEPTPPLSVNQNLPAPLNSLILAMLAKEPTARLSAQEIATQLGEAVLSSEQVASAATSPPKAWVRHRGPWVAALAGCLVIAVAIGWFAFGGRESQEFAELKIQPLTSQAGWEEFPALSPDGRSVAFTWTDKLDGTRQIYVKQFGDSEPRRVTNFESESDVGSLVWSPDGKRIAFKRGYKGTAALYSIASTGGDTQKLLDLSDVQVSSAIDWSPDGKQMAFSDMLPGSDRFAIYVFNLRTKEKRKLTSPPPEDWGDWSPEFSPDGSRLAFKRVTGFWVDDIYLVPTRGGALQRVTAARRGIWGHAWMPDGKGLIVSCQRESTIFGIWQFPLSREARPERISQGGVDAITPATGRKTSRVAWVNQLWDLNIYRVSISGLGAPVKLIASTVRDQGAQYSPNGRIAFISDRSGSREIWIARGAGSGQVRVTNLNGPQIDHLQWAPDGRHLAFDSRPYGHADIFTLECDSAAMRCSEPKRLASAGSAEAPSWSSDGKFIYFASERTGGWELWRLPAFGGPATQVTQNQGYTSHESADGKWLYFSKVGGDCIWRIPGSKSDGGSGLGEELVIGSPFRVQAEGWALTSDEIIFIDHARRSEPPAMRAYRIRTKQMRSILRLSEIFSDRGDIGVSVSPDSRWILYSQLDRSGSDVMVADNIR